MIEQKQANNSRTDFGYEQVPVEQKAKKVAEVFHSVASRYDLMNDVMSLGVHRCWKRFAVMLSGVRRGQRVLDLAGGTGDLTRQFSSRVGHEGSVILADINESMLSLGRDRLLDEGLPDNISYTQLNAESLSFAENSMDCITIAFGLRNVTDKARALRSMYYTLKPGGCLLILEFSLPQWSWLRMIYDQYSFSLLPQLGKWITNDEASYRYLAESIRMHPNQETLKTMVTAAGFEDCCYHNLSGGIVAVHKAYKY